MGGRDVKYWVISDRELLKATVEGPQRQIVFDTYNQANIYKTGLETLNPKCKYAIMRTIPEKHEQVSVLTGERDMYDY